MQKNSFFYHRNFLLLVVLLLSLVSSSCAKLGLSNEFCFKFPPMKFDGLPGDPNDPDAPVFHGTLPYEFSYNVYEELAANVPTMQDQSTLKDLEVSSKITSLEVTADSGIEDFSFSTRMQFSMSDPAGVLGEQQVLDYKYNADDDVDGTLVMDVPSEQQVEVGQYLKVTDPLNFKVRLTGDIPLTTWGVTVNVCLTIDTSAMVSL